MLDFTGEELWRFWPPNGAPLPGRAAGVSVFARLNQQSAVGWPVLLQISHCVGACTGRELDAAGEDTVVLEDDRMAGRNGASAATVDWAERSAPPDKSMPAADRLLAASRSVSYVVSRVGQKLS